MLKRQVAKWAIAAWIVFFILIMAGMLGGIFPALSLTLCEGLAQAGGLDERSAHVAYASSRASTRSCTCEITKQITQ